MKRIRRSDLAEGGISNAEREAMATLCQEWIDIAFRTKPADLDILATAIRGIYEAAKLAAPRIILVSSPLAMSIAGGFAAGIWYLRAATRAATHDATYAATDAATRAATRAATDAATRAATLDATYDATRAATHDATDAATYAAPYAATYAATHDAWAVPLARQLAPDNPSLLLNYARDWTRLYQGGNMWSGWDCYLVAARDILGLRLKSHEYYRFWEAAARNGGFRVMHEKFCMVSDFPEFIKVDAQNRPHCAEGPSHRWRDGWSIYHWHGTRVHQHWIEGKASAGEVLAEDNIEVRRAGCEIIGWHRILAELNAESIDCDADPEIGELVEIDDRRLGGRARYLKVRCPTGRDFALSVPLEMQTALQANAWSYGMTPEELFNLEGRS